jgi:hypothetical protein
MMKKILAAILLVPAISIADTSVSNSTSKDVTFVKAHYQSDSNSVRFDNNPIQRNMNRHTRQSGTSQDEFNSPLSYSQSYEYQQPMLN